MQIWIPLNVTLYLLKVVNTIESVTKYIKALRQEKDNA